MEQACWTLRCVDIPTGGGDADVAWEVIQHHEAKHHERMVSHGKTPTEALQNAIEPKCPNCNDANEYGDYEGPTCEVCGGIGRALSTPPVAAESNASVEAIELAYGLLWVVGCDRSTPGGNALYLARKALLEQLDRAGQGRGISAARKVLKDEEAGCGGLGYSVSGRVCSDLDGRTSSRSGDTGACDPASGGVASLHNDGHPEGAARPDGLSVEARLREALSHTRERIAELLDEKDVDDDGILGEIDKALSAVGDEATKSIPVQDAESASGAHVAGRTGGAQCLLNRSE
jgi:hypothetical protein